MSTPVLAHFRVDYPTLVTCDDSVTAAGAVLSQLQNSIKRPVAFASCAFSWREGGSVLCMGLQSLACLFL